MYCFSMSTYLGIGSVKGRMVEVPLSKGRKEEVGKMQSSLSNLKSESVHHSHDAEKKTQEKRYKEK